MSTGSSFDAKEQIRQAVDIVDLVGSYLELRREGRLYKALCPWHNDTRPSLQVNPDRQTWKCWVCDVGGDIFSFVMQREGVGFREALQMLADRAGIELSQGGGDRPRPQAGSPDDKRTLYQAMAWAEETYHRYLVEASDAQGAREYLSGRGITDESIQRFRLGYAPNEWSWLAARAEQQRNGFSPAVLQRVGLVARGTKSDRLYDRFKGRVLFPIRDPQRRPIALGGRILPEYADERAAKYVNSPETPLFSKSNQLYALDLARDAIAKTRSVLVMEGYTDVIVAHQCGLGNAVAVLGTALGERHITILRRLADSITLVLDGDEAGRRRANEILELFVAQQVDLKILTLPDGQDPCDFLLQHGGESFTALVGKAVDALDHKIQLAAGGVDSISDTHQANAALEEILTTLAKAPRLHDGTRPETRLREGQILSRLARQFRVPEEDVRGRLTALRSAARRHSGRSEPLSDESSVSSASAGSDAWERELLELLLQEPESTAEVMQSVRAEMMIQGPCREIYEACCRLAEQNVTPTIDRLLVEFDAPELKNLLVRLDEQGARRQQHDRASSGAAAVRLNDLLARYRQRQQTHRWRADQAVLSEGQMAPDEELAALQRIVEEKRSRMGISEPMDG